MTPFDRAEALFKMFGWCLPINTDVRDAIAAAIRQAEADAVKRALSNTQPFGSFKAKLSEEDLKTLYEYTKQIEAAAYERAAQVADAEAKRLRNGGAINACRAIAADIRALARGEG